MTPQPHLSAGWRRALDRLGGRPPVPKQPVRASAPSVATTRPETRLEVRDLRVVFGGLAAVDGVSLSAPTGRITGLIGPNGAGKTTTFNACTGLVRPGGGRIMLGSKDISRYGPSRRAREGLGRTFQEMQLFESLTVSANVAIGREAALAGINPVSQILSRPREGSLVRDAVEEAIDLCDLGPLRHAIVGDLSTGQRRLVELARCFAGQYDIMLLDEPSSGLDRSETEQVGEILERFVAERGAGILLVEHDMDLVMEVCSYLYVLDFGQLIFQGTPAEARGSEVVRAAYLGTGAVVPEVGRE